MAVNQKREPPLTPGFFPVTPDNGVTTFALNAAATWLAFAFNPDSSKTVSTLSFYVTAVGGTLAATDISCDIYSDTAGSPNASLVSSTTFSPALAANTWVDCTISQALTGATQYHAVLKNSNATPATNFPTFRIGSAGMDNNRVLGGNGTWGWYKKSSTNSGGTWGTFVGSVIGFRVGYTDGSFDGWPIENSLNGVAGDGAQGTQEGGVTFVSDPAPYLVRGVFMFVGKVGAPAGSLRFRIYLGTTLLDTTAVIPTGNVSTTMGYLASYFATTRTIPASSLVRVVFGTTTGGDASNFYRSIRHVIRNDAASKKLMPFGTDANATNALKKTVLASGSWTDTDTEIMPFGLILDSDGQLPAPTGGGPGPSPLVVSGQTIVAY